MPNNKWSSFKIVANYNVSPKKIYNAFSIPRELEKWFLREAIFFHKNLKIKNTSSIKKGYSYRWRWHGFTDEVCETGEILKANGKNSIWFTFTKSCIVKILIKRKNGITLLELTQTNIPSENNPLKNLYVQCSIGWTFYLANLKSVIEGGIDLRNKNVKLLTNFK